LREGESSDAGTWRLAALATSTASAAALAELSFNGLDGIAATSRGLLCDARKGFAFVVDCIQAKEFALVHWLVNGANGGRQFVRCFDGDGIVRENAVGDVLASLTTMLWNAPSKSWTGGATMADATSARRRCRWRSRSGGFRERGMAHRLQRQAWLRHEVTHRATTAPTGCCRCRTTPLRTRHAQPGGDSPSRRVGISSETVGWIGTAQRSTG
jgi:hypothetical protein